MIDTNAIRAKAADVAVTGQLTADYISESSADKDLKNMGIVPGNIEDDEIPYKLKNGWEWVRMVDLGADTKNSFADGPFGSNLKREHYTTDKQVRIIQLSNVGELGWKDDNEKYTTFEHLETIKRSEVEAGNIVIANMMPAGRAILVPDVTKAYVLSSDCVKFVPNDGLNARYLCYAINSQMFKKQVLQEVHGIGRERTSLSKLKSYLLPIPPVDEQTVIVEKIDSIYEMLERIDDLQEKYRNDLATLKAKIIDAGIRGKLTEQLPEDGDAETLYAQIQEEKAKLIKEGKLRKTRGFDEISEEVVPYDFPSRWSICYIDDIAFVTKLAGFEYTKNIADNICKEGIPLFKGKNIQKGELILNFESFIPQSVSDELPRSKVNKKCLLTPYVGTIGNIALFDGSFEAHLGSNVGKIEILNPEVPCLLEEFLLYYLRSDIGYSELTKHKKATAQDSISIDAIRNVIIAIPSLEEQKRIIKVIDDTFSAIDGL